MTEIKFSKAKEAKFKRTPGKLSEAERISIIKRFKLSIPRNNVALKAIAECHDSFDGRTPPDHILITGASRLGKSTICQTFEDQHPRILTDTDNRIRVLRVNTPAPATIHSLISEALATLGDPKPDLGRNIGEKTRRLVNLTKSLRVEIILWDEFQHFDDVRKGSPMKDVLNWFKNLTNLVPIPMVLVGLPNSEAAIAEDEQLNNRISERIKLQSFQWSNKNHKSEFKRLLQEIDICLPFDDEIGLTLGDMPVRFFRASKGVLGHLTKLIRKAAKMEVKAGEQTIHIETLAIVWEKSIRSSIGDIANPFLLANEIYEDGKIYTRVRTNSTKMGENNRWSPKKRKTPISQILRRNG